MLPNLTYWSHTIIQSLSQIRVCCQQLVTGRQNDEKYSWGETIDGLWLKVAM